MPMRRITRRGERNLSHLPEERSRSARRLSNDSRTTAGILLLTIVAVEYGGLVMLRIVRGNQPATDFQRAFARAGHAHAGVFVVFALVAQILADSADLHGVANALARDGIWVAAILFPAGFFLLARATARRTDRPIRLRNPPQRRALKTGATGVEPWLYTSGDRDPMTCGEDSRSAPTRIFHGSMLTVRS